MRTTSRSCVLLAALATMCVLVAGCDDGGSGAPPGEECVPSGPETCNSIDDDCDGVVDDVYDADTHPACSTTETYFLSGDVGNDLVTVSGTTERWFRVRFREDSSGLQDIWGLLEFSGPSSQPNPAFEVYVYCEPCGGTPMAHAGPGSGVVNFFKVDYPAQSNGFNALVQVRFLPDAGAGYCDGWVINLHGHELAGAGDTVTCG